MAAASTVSFTSCTRTMCAPFMMQITAAARLPTMRSPAGVVTPRARGRPSDKRFSRRSRQQREPERGKFLEAGEQRVIFFEALAEAEAGIEHQPVARDTGAQSAFARLAQLVADQRDHIVHLRQRAPLVRPAAGMHEHGAAAQFGDGALPSPGPRESR